MVNRYITALLVVLAATGLEAQTYQQALRYALTDISYDEFIQRPEVKALEEDLLCALKSLREATADKSDRLLHPSFTSAMMPAEVSLLRSYDKHCISSSPATACPCQAHYGSIVIRGPDFPLQNS